MTLAGRLRSSAGVGREWLRVPTPLGFSDLPPTTAWDPLIGRWLPMVFAISTGFQLTKYVVVPAGLGFDARLYVDATRAWLSGGDPWAVSQLGVAYAAPPPTLLATIPLLLVPDALLVPIVIIGTFLLAAAAIRAIGLPWWWLAFWPIVDGALVGSLDLAVLATLVLAGRRLDIFAPFLKIFAVVPMVGDQRWRSLALVGIVLAVTAPLLPWGEWWSSRSEVAAGLARTSQTTSVFGSLPLMVVATVALLSLGARRAGWLAVPLLWPWTQVHYMVISLPAMSPLIALVWCLPGVPPVGILGSIVVVAIAHRLRPLRMDRGARQPSMPVPSSRRSIST